MSFGDNCYGVLAWGLEYTSTLVMEDLPENVTFKRRFKNKQINKRTEKRETGVWGKSIPRKGLENGSKSTEVKM